MLWFLTLKVCYVTRSGESVGAAERSKMIFRVKYTGLSLAGWRQRPLSHFQWQRRVIRVSSDLDMLEIT